MKIIFLIFSFYLLVLPGLACAETGIYMDDLQSSVTQDDGQSGHEQDDCGSFCTCSCCVHIVSVNMHSLKIFIARPSELSILPAIYNNISLPSNYFGNIWQPPKIS